MNKCFKRIWQGATEQRANIKFCFKLGKSATDTFEMIQTVYGSEAMSRKNVFKWYASFRDGRESIEDDPRPGASSTVRVEENVQKVAEILRNDRCASTRLIEELTGIPKTTVHRILTENLGKKKICFVPHLLLYRMRFFGSKKYRGASTPSLFA
ncbi:Protein GVQW3 [Anthophora quadrimaculata]